MQFIGQNSPLTKNWPWDKLGQNVGNFQVEKKFSAKNTGGKNKKKLPQKPCKKPTNIAENKNTQKKKKMCLHFHPVFGQVGEADEQDPPNPSCFNPFSNFKYGGKGGLITSLSVDSLTF